MNQVAPKAKQGIPWWVWLAIAGGLAVPACGGVAALSIYGVRKYIMNAKTAEGRAMLPRLAEGVARCASETTAQGTRGLPRSSRSVPVDVSLVSGSKYQSAPDEWSDEAFVCAGFSMPGPQYFVYQWRSADVARGSAVAQADLDGDGTPDKDFEMSVACSGTGPCVVGPLIER